MSKLPTAILMAALGTPVAAGNLIMMINGVRPIDVIPGTELHSFTIDRPELFPTTCPAQRLVISADLPLADTALGLILDIEDEGARFAELEYKLKSDGQCHVWKFAKEDSSADWSIHNLFLQAYLWPATDADKIVGQGRLVAIGCPTNWTSENELWWEWKNNWTQSESTMIGRWGDWCDSGSYKFQIPGDGYAEWRVCDYKSLFGACTDWVTLVPTP